MYDIEIHLPNRPGELARMGRALGEAGVSVEGGGVFVVDDVGVAHFLVADGDAARAALTAAGLEVVACREALLLRLDQEVPGQLGALAAAMAERGVNIEVQYSDHDNQLVLLVDDMAAARDVRDDWMAERKLRQMTARVAHEIPDRPPIILQPGDTVVADERDTRWPAFVFVTARSGTGWVPSRHLSASSGEAVVGQAYDTTELPTRPGQRLVVLEEDRISGWAWCRAPDGREGWVPFDTLDLSGG